MYWSCSNDDAEKTLSNAVFTNLLGGYAAHFSIEKTVTSIGMYESTGIVITGSDGSRLANSLFTYSVSDGKVADVTDSGVVTGLSVGSCTVTVSSPFMRKSIVITVRRGEPLCMPKPAVRLQ